MEYLWLLVAVSTLVVYPVVLLRSAMKGKRWALETLEAMRYLGGEMNTASAWREMPPRDRRCETAERDEPAEDAEESAKTSDGAGAGRLVA